MDEIQIESERSGVEGRNSSYKALLSASDTDTFEPVVVNEDGYDTTTCAYTDAGPRSSNTSLDYSGYTALDVSSLFFLNSYLRYLDFILLM